MKLFLIWTSGSGVNISYLELWRPSCSAERNRFFFNFGRGHNGEHSCEIILNLDLWFRMGCLKKKFTDDAQGTMDEDRLQ